MKEGHIGKKMIGKWRSILLRFYTELAECACAATDVKYIKHLRFEVCPDFCCIIVYT